MGSRPLDDGFGCLLDLLELVARWVHGVAENDCCLTSLLGRETIDALCELRELVDGSAFDVREGCCRRLGGPDDTDAETALLRRLGGKECKDRELQKDGDEGDSLHRDLAKQLLEEPKLPSAASKGLMFLNPSSGARLGESELSALRLAAMDAGLEVHDVTPSLDIGAVVRGRLRQGRSLVAAAGGAGTVQHVGQSV